MNKTNLPIKESTKLRLCGYCIAIKNRSKKFTTSYSLTWHISYYHKEDIGIITPVKVSPPEIFSREIID